MTPASAVVQQPTILAQAAPVILDAKPAGIILSPSQIDRWDMCQRWWAWQYIAKIRSPQNAAAKLGGEVHAHLEKWLRDATPPPDTKSGIIAQRMIPTLIAHGVLPGSGVVERRFWFRTRLGHQYTGFIDWSGVLGDMVATVIDHKTSGDLRWAKTEADLHNDIQAVIYAVVGFVGFGTDTLQLMWNYGETKKKKNTYAVKPVKTTVHLAVVADKFERVIEPVAAEIIFHHHAQNHPLSFPPSPQSCGAYGGCPHQGRCNLTDQEKLGGIMTDQQQQPSMAQRMEGQMAAANGGQQGGIQQPAQQPANPAALPAGAPPAGAPPAGAPPMGMAPPAVQQAPVQQAPVQQAPVQQLQAPGGFSAPPALPQQQQPLQQPTQSLGAPGGPQQPPQQPYAPTVAPNPPETGMAPPPQETAAPKEGTKAGPGRPKGVRNKTLSLDAQVFMMGVTAGMGHPSFNPGGPEAAQTLITLGDMALAAYKAKF